VESEGWDKVQKLAIQVDDCDDGKSELIFDPTEKVKENHKVDTIPASVLSLSSKPIINNDSLVAIGSDIFKSSNIIKTKPIAFSDAIEMIQFILELNRRISIFQRYDVFIENTKP
jgi:hypothetical protein